MATLLSDDEINSRLLDVPSWNVRAGWLCRTYSTPGWSHTLLLVNQIAFIAEAAWHHPDLEIGYARVVVKLQTHKAGGLTAMDFELARRIEELVIWRPTQDSSLEGYPRKWIS